MPTPSAVNQLLLASLAGERPTTENLDTLDWDALWVSARDHCLTPYLHKHWTESGFFRVLPEATASRFVNARWKNSERNRQLMVFLGELRAALEAAGIPILISKGLPVAQNYYSDLGLRVLYDLDLFIDPRERARARELLHEIGYEPFSELDVHQDQQLFWRPKDYCWDPERVFDPDQPCFVELHTMPWEPGWHGFGLRCDLNLWEDHRLQEVSGVPLRVPSEEKLLVHLAVHYACNVLESNARLMHLLDIALILRLRGPDLRWDRVLNDIVESRVAPFCFLALDLAERLGNCCIPREVWNALCEATPGAIVDWIRSRGAQEVASMNLHHRDPSLIYRLHWNMAEQWTEKARVLYRSLSVPWGQAAGPDRFRSLAARLVKRLHHMAHRVAG